MKKVRRSASSLDTDTALLLVFGSISNRDYNFDAEDILRSLTAQSMWLVRSYQKSFDSLPKRAVFYQTKIGFRAQAKIISVRPIERADAVALAGFPKHIFGFKLLLDEIMLFHQHIPMPALVDKLSFVSNSKHWGAYVRRSVNNISYSDFNVISKAALSRRR